MAQTLEELKEENKQADAAAQGKSDKPEAKAPKGLDDGKKPVSIAEDADLHDDEGGSPDSDIWMQTDDQTSDDGEVEAKFTDSDVAAVRRKLKGKLQKEREEKDELAEENARLKAQLAQQSGNNQTQQARQQSPAQQNRMPRLSDFGYDEDKHEAAMARWVQSQSAAALQVTSRKQVESEARRQVIEKTERAVDDHYQRASELITKANIDPEVYRAADTEVRRAVEEVFPEMGDPITDAIIARLGEGSEKVVYYLGRNKSKKAEFVASLREDPSGVAAAIMLGTLKSQIAGSGNRVSNANKPSTQLNGDAGGSEAASKLKRKYTAASGNDAASVQKRINIKREAKAQGIDVSGW